MRSSIVLAFLAALGGVVLSGAPARATAPAKETVAGKKIVLPFIEDDFARAVAEAKARKVPLFIEAWAPW